MFEFNHGHVGPRYICGALRQFDAASFLFCQETNLHCLVVSANLSHAIVSNLNRSVMCLLVLYSNCLGQRLWNRTKTVLVMNCNNGEPWYLTKNPCLLVVVTGVLLICHSAWNVEEPKKKWILVELGHF